MQPIAELPFISGNLGLDLINTAEERGNPSAGDALLTPADLRVWGIRAGVITSAQSSGSEAQVELERAREARELLYELFHAEVQEAPASKAQLAHLADLAADAYAAGTLGPKEDGGLRWQWSPTKLSSVRHAAVTSAIELLASGPGARLKQCPGEHCGWFFLDATKRGNRRWCRMSECGQEAKDERRREKRRSSAPRTTTFT